MVYVNVYFHVIRENMTTEGGNVDQNTVNKQIAVFNEYFNQKNPMNFTFILQETTYTTNAAWFRRGGQAGLGEDVAMSKKLRRGGCSDLNVYTVFSPQRGHAMGISSMPSTCKEAISDDGITLDHLVLPGSPYFGGMTGLVAAHELEHWLGLFHTFDGGCSYPNDHIHDTNFEKEPSFGPCEPRSSCVNGTFDAVDNISPELRRRNLQHKFTLGQAVFAHKNWQAFRKSNYSGP
ncbi:BQ2448_7896 [Microbotryum intermedium]|uniref:BQ2448_7896 protein n=1 Tax=Microbotryum intermedium TaxID=269621 RepID=A0A238FNK6_9BASI|nr:BQ2448_7896 [Microbotryum intermedium]